MPLERSAETLFSWAIDLGNQHKFPAADASTATSWGPALHRVRRLLAPSPTTHQPQPQTFHTLIKHVRFSAYPTAPYYSIG